MTVVPDGPACSCGSHGCLEIYAAGPAITGQGVRLLLAGQTTCLYDLVEGRPERVNPAVMAQAAALVNGTVRAVLVQAAEYSGHLGRQHDLDGPPAPGRFWEAASQRSGRCCLTPSAPSSAGTSACSGGGCGDRAVKVGRSRRPAGRHCLGSRRWYLKE